MMGTKSRFQWINEYLGGEESKILNLDNYSDGKWDSKKKQKKDIYLKVCVV